jgi:hypothetical protein
VIRFGRRTYEIDLIVIRFDGNNSPIDKSLMYCKYIKRNKIIM